MTRPAATAPDTLVAYDEDFALWAGQQARLIEEGRFRELDRTNLADEVADLARNEKRALRGNLVVVLKHLLQCRHKSERLSRSWMSTLDEHRDRIAEILDESPSLRRVLREKFPVWYNQARRQAAHEMDKPLADIDDACPFTVEQALDAEWLPPEAGPLP
jgi:hypothetical protein